jgi:hypothetical protein
LSTLLAVWKLTPARAATSLIETYFRRAIHSRPCDPAAQCCSVSVPGRLAARRGPRLDERSLTP